MEKEMNDISQAESPNLVNQTKIRYTAFPQLIKLNDGEDKRGGRHLGNFMKFFSKMYLDHCYRS